MSTDNFKISFHKAKNLSELSDLLKDTEIKFTFFGAKKVSKENFYNSVSLDKIASKALLLISPYLNKWNYSLATRNHIKDITKKINKFYEKTDRKRKKSNLFTQIFYIIRNIFPWLFQTRKKWDNITLEIDPSNYYTSHQFKTAFPLNQVPRKADKKYKNINLYLKPTIIIGG